MSPVRYADETMRGAYRVKALSRGMRFRDTLASNELRLGRK